MKIVMERLRKNFSRRSGQSMVEYTLIVALVAIVCIVALTTFGTSSSAKVGSVSSALK